MDQWYFRFFRMAVQVSQIGLVALAPAVLGAYLGFRLDNLYHKTLVYTVCLSILGLISGLFNVYRVLVKIGSEESGGKRLVEGRSAKPGSTQKKSGKKQ